MDKNKEVEEKTRKLSSKLGALFVKELLIKQYKLNYLQKLKAQSQAFNRWRSACSKSAEEKKGMCNVDVIIFDFVILKNNLNRNFQARIKSYF